MKIIVKFIKKKKSMEIRIHTNCNQKIQKNIHEKIQKVAKAINPASQVDVYITWLKNGNGRNNCKLNINYQNGTLISASGAGDIYQAINKASQSLIRQGRAKKDKTIQRKRRSR